MQSAVRQIFASWQPTEYACVGENEGINRFEKDTVQAEVCGQTAQILMSEMGRFLPVVTVREFVGSATCYAGSTSGRSGIALIASNG
jgi:hypothetical protein